MRQSSLMIRLEHLWDREREVPVRHGRKDGLGQQCAEELHLFLVAGGAEPPALARERQQILMGAVVAAHAGKPVGKIPAAHELANDLRDDRAQEPVIVLVGLGIDGPGTCQNARPDIARAARILACGHGMLEPSSPLR